jgi:hypothetical protein
MKNNSTKQVYIDGALFLNGTSTGNFSTQTARALTIGADFDGTLYTNAVIDDVALYKGALSLSNMAALTAGSKPTDLPVTAGLMAYWDFNKDFYLSAQSNLYCNPSSQDILTAAQCQAAASYLGLIYGSSWNRTGTYQGCFLALDGRDLVYFNTAGNAACSSPCNPMYRSLCSGNYIIQ